MEKKNARLALILSLFPGASHLYLGLVRKAVVLLIIDAGLVLTLIFSKSYLMKLVMANIYLFTAVPAALETTSLAQGKKSRIDTDATWYTVALLLTTGFSALPLLWQNPKFSRRFKIAWTVAVPLLALLYFWGLLLYWDTLEALLVRLFQNGA